MILSDRDIGKAVAAGRIGIDRFKLSNVQAASYDFRLGEEFLVPSDQDRSINPIDPVNSPQDLSIGMKLQRGPLMLGPRSFALGSSMERFTLPNDMVARVEGKSSIGRIGLSVHVTAGFIDPGFSGTITLELVNHRSRPIVLTPGMLIAQLSFMMMTGAADIPYGSKYSTSHYQGQSGVTASRYGVDIG